jgi:hypothetical protein
VSSACRDEATNRVAAEQRLKRGAYLVNAVMACDNCHTPRTKNGLDMQRRFSGGSEVWETVNYRVQGSNITMDRETGIGAWTDADIKRLLTEGMRPNGERVAPQMPWRFYKLLTPSDLDAVVSYIRNVRPLRHRMPRPLYKTSAYAGPAGDQSSAPPVSRGSYLASLAYCMACHSRRPDGAVDLKNWLGRGGFQMKGDYGSVVVPNISSSSDGVGSWTDAELRRALVSGVGRDGHAFKLPMARQRFYSGMSQQDLDAIVQWIRAIPPVPSTRSR